jgi:GWxTD domain-containing protein
MRRICILAVAALFSVSSLLAADLGKYKDWSASPAAYYLTGAERAEWAKLQSEADAEQFVQKYNGIRGGETFTKELTKRIAMADKYLTVGATPGSQSTRGKIVILLGPPASMNIDIKQPRSKGGHTGTADMGMSAGGEGGGASNYDIASVAARDDMSNSDSGLRDYNFQYMAAALPTKQDTKLTVEVNARSGKDRIADKKAAAALDQLFETVAQKSIAKK